jgi:ATP-dependent exoDNAse (exonuclease V) beta subunit
MVQEALAAIDAVCAERAACLLAGDKLRERLDAIATYAAALRSIDDEIDLLEALGDDGPSFRCGNIGKSAHWNLDMAPLKARVAAAGAGLDAVRQRVTDACAQRIAAAIRHFTLDAAHQRQAAGQLEFHDLLVLARALLRDPVHGPVVRRRLHGRYQRLLLDEFQDTDPIQIELAVRIAAADPADPAAGELDWPDVVVAPGHLFVVGDPKQSIYRFRRADIATFLAARQRFGPALQLTTNFRSGRPVIQWVNHTFAQLMEEPPEAELPVASQADYVALSAERPAPRTGPPVSVLGRLAHAKDSPADELRSLEVAEVAAAVARVVEEGWSVSDGAGGWRPARLGDVCVLLPARTSLPFLEDALEEAMIPFRAESSSLVYASRAVRDLVMVVRAVDDPTDYLRIVSALRTPLLACGDDDLFRFKVERQGRWSYLVDQPDTVPADDPVAVGLGYLRRLHEQRWWLAPSQLLDRIARDRRALELGFAEGRPRDVWRRLRFVIDQARAWSEATGGSLRQYLYWVDQQTAEGARVAESVLPETDDDAIRIMTIHSAKGLEFPVTVVSGLSTVPQTHRSPAEVVWPASGGVGYKFGRHVTTDEYAQWAPIDEQMGYDERIRLLYVACTRAKDHLIVSLHRKQRAGAKPRPGARTNAELLLDGMGALLDRLPDAVAQGRLLLAPAVSRPEAIMPVEEWADAWAVALADASRPMAVAATALTDEGAPDPGLQKRPRDLDLPPWLKGRYGTAVGRAVHGVLQTIDLAGPSGSEAVLDAAVLDAAVLDAAVLDAAVLDAAELDAAVAAQCEAEAVSDRAADVRQLVSLALGSPSVAEAAINPHWREVYACTPIDGRLLEGYIDLLYQGPDGLVVVDYKTAATADAAELDSRVEGYRLQGASYALAVAATTGQPVVRVTFVFLTPEGAVERHLPDLDQAVADVRRLVQSGSEVLVD